MKLGKYKFIATLLFLLNVFLGITAVSSRNIWEQFGLGLLFFSMALMWFASQFRLSLRKVLYPLTVIEMFLVLVIGLFLLLNSVRGLDPVTGAVQNGAPLFLIILSSIMILGGLGIMLGFLTAGLISTRPSKEIILEEGRFDDIVLDELGQKNYNSFKKTGLIGIIAGILASLIGLWYTLNPEGDIAFGLLIIILPLVLAVIIFIGRLNIRNAISSKRLMVVFSILNMITVVGVLPMVFGLICYSRLSKIKP